MCFSCGFRSLPNQEENVVPQPRQPIGSPVYQEKANARTLNGPTIVNGKLVEKQRNENGEVVSHGFIPVASRMNFTDAQLEDFRAFFAEKKAAASLKANTQTVLGASQSAADAITSTTAFVQQQLKVVQSLPLLK